MWRPAIPLWCAEFFEIYGDAARRHGSQRVPGEGSLREGGHGGASEDSLVGLQGAIGQTAEEGGEGETGNDVGKEWCRSFRHGRLPLCCATDTKERNNLRSPLHSPDLIEMYDLMTEEEKEELTNRLRQRREAVPVSDTELDPPYQQ